MSAKTGTRGLGAMLIFCIVFIGAFIALIGIIPPEYFVQTKTYYQYEYPDYFTQDDIARIKHFLNKTVEEGRIWFDFESKGAKFKFLVDMSLWADGYRAYQNHIIWEWWIFYDSHPMYFTENKYLYVNAELAKKYWDSDINATVLYPVFCEDITVKVWITDYNGSRNDIETAFNEGKVIWAIGFGYEDYETKLSAWDIVGRLLTFQSPEIFGLSGTAATILNLIVALPIWTAIAYLVYRLILMAIPFV